MNPNFRLSRVGVIILGVADLGHSVTFYRERLGLELTSQTDNFSFFNAGGITLALSTNLSRALGKEPGAVEVVFSVDHVRVAYVELQGRGIVFRDEPRIVTGTMRAANFSDPDGHALSIFGPE
jgi:catechol 2,3-dioxygenase-like lactoylglutathione lyase family enzyme